MRLYIEREHNQGDLRVTVDEAYNIVQALPSSDRHMLLTRLIDDIDRQDRSSDSDAETFWTQEVQDRIATYDRGEMKAEPWRDAMKDLYDSLDRGRNQ
jgi:putative addiction module component